MEWLSQNWIWVVVGIGVVWLLAGGRHGGLMSCCGARGMAREGSSDQGKAQSMDATRPPMQDEKAEQPAAPAASSHRHGRGGCC